MQYNTEIGLLFFRLYLSLFGYLSPLIEQMSIMTKVDELLKDATRVCGYGPHTGAVMRLIEAMKLMVERPQQDTIGDCLTCGAKDGQFCFRGCGK